MAKAPDVYKNLARIDGAEARVSIAPIDAKLPLALGVELPGGYTSPVVPAGARLPRTGSAKFSTAGSFQMAAEFHVLLGNRPLVRDDISLCRIRVRNVKWGGAGVPQIELRFDVDKRGTLTVSAANLDRSDAETIVYLATDEVSADDVQRALAEARTHEAEDERMRDLIQNMLDCHAAIGANDDCYSVAKRKMGYAQKRAYKNARKRLEKALSVAPSDATEASIAELVAAEQEFRAQRQVILPLYQQVMNWYR